MRARWDLTSPGRLRRFGAKNTIADADAVNTAGNFSS